MKILQRAHLFILIILAAWYSYLGWMETFYRMGIFLVPIIMLAAGVVSGAIVLSNKKWRKSWFKIFSWIGAIGFAGLIIAHKIEHYKPTYPIYIPESYEGMVYLLPGKHINEELFIDQNGIGYYAPGKEVEVKVYHGEENSTNALNEYGDRTLIFPNADSTSYESIHITCFEVERGRVYGSSPWNQTHARCMDEQTYLQLVAAGIIDESRVKKVVFPVQ